VNILNNRIFSGKLTGLLISCEIHRHVQEAPNSLPKAIHVQEYIGELQRHSGLVGIPPPQVPGVVLKLAQQLE